MVSQKMSTLQSVVLILCILNVITVYGNLKCIPCYPSINAPDDVSGNKAYEWKTKLLRQFDGKSQSDFPTCQEVRSERPFKNLPENMQFSCPAITLENDEEAACLKLTYNKRTDWAGNPKFDWEYRSCGKVKRNHIGKCVENFENNSKMQMCYCNDKDSCNSGTRTHVEYSLFIIIMLHLLLK